MTGVQTCALPILGSKVILLEIAIQNPPFWEEFTRDLTPSGPWEVPTKGPERLGDSWGRHRPWNQGGLRASWPDRPGGPGNLKIPDPGEPQNSPKNGKITGPREGPEKPGNLEIPPGLPRRGPADRPTFPNQRS